MADDLCAEHLPGTLKIGGSIDTERNGVNDSDVDAQTVFERAQLLKLFAHFKW